jgi:hypothetical protein
MAPPQRRWLASMDHDPIMGIKMSNIQACMGETSSHPDSMGLAPAM